MVKNTQTQTQTQDNTWVYQKSFLNEIVIAFKEVDNYYFAQILNGLQFSQEYGAKNLQFVVKHQPDSHESLMVINLESLEEYKMIKKDQTVIRLYNGVYMKLKLDGFKIRFDKVISGSQYFREFFNR